MIVQEEDVGTRRWMTQFIRAEKRTRQNVRSISSLGAAGRRGHGHGSVQIHDSCDRHRWLSMRCCIAGRDQSGGVEVTMTPTGNSLSWGFLEILDFCRIDNDSMAG